MAFARSGWNPIGGQSKKGSAPAMWSFGTTDPIATVNTTGYFNNVSDEVSVRDIIFIQDTATPMLSIVSVRSNASGVVDVSDGHAIEEDDAD